MAKKTFNFETPYREVEIGTLHIEVEAETIEEALEIIKERDFTKMSAEHTGTTCPDGYEWEDGDVVESKEDKEEQEMLDNMSDTLNKRIDEINNK